MAKPRSKQVCPACHGSGRVDLSGLNLATYKLLVKHPGKTAAELARLAGLERTAMANRLSKLIELGRASSERSGRKFVYRGK